MQTTVVIVGAGPAGLATSVCLAQNSIPHVILEREDCNASLWRKRTYDRLKLHLAKEFCSLPFMPFPPSFPTFLPKHTFIQYLDDYVSTFNIQPQYHRSVESAVYDEVARKWVVEAKNVLSGKFELYTAKFLVVATGENDEGFIPNFPGLDSFRGEVVHCSEYKSGLKYQGKRVLVVGCGNSGMEIAYDLSSFGVSTSIVVSNPVHVVNKEIVRLGMWLCAYVPISVVDFITVMLEKLIYGDLSKYGLYRPKEGPFFMKLNQGKAPVIDVGTIKRIKERTIKVFPGIASINENMLLFKTGVEAEFDAIVFATGYRSKASDWLKEYKYILNNKGMPKKNVPNHWKGENRVYCAGLSRNGLWGISKDAQAIAEDIKEQVLKG